MVESGTLLRCYTGNCIEGSNPSLSAMKNLILLIIISTTFVFGQTDNNAPSPFSTSEDYKVELKKKGKEGKITFSEWRSKEYPNRVVYAFFGKIKKKDIKSSTVEKSYDDKVVAKRGNDTGLWYDYSFDVYSYYNNDQLKEKGGVEHRYSDVINSNNASGKLANTVLLGIGKQKGYVLKDGIWQGWYDSGELRYSATYVNGKLHGQVDVYFKNGQKKSGGEYSYNRKVGQHAEWYKSGWIKEYSVDGVVKRSHKESDQAFFWNSKKDKNYQAAYALAQKAFLNAVDSDGDSVGRNKDSVELKSKSKPIIPKRIYTQFVFTGDLKVMTYSKTTRVRETDPYVLEALDAGVAQNYGFSYYKNKTQTYYVNGTGERTYFIECDDGECSIVDEESQY